MRRAWLVLVVVGAAGAGWYLTRPAPEPVTAVTGELPTVPVVRTDLTKAIAVDGTLGYGQSERVLGGGRGRITWLPKAGRVIGRGDPAYRINGVEVPLLIGAAPLWRTLSTGVADGSDVRILEQNLKALGYADQVTVDRTFTGETARAVRRWQRDLGRPRTGTVAPDDVVVRPAAIRVTTVAATLGEDPGRALFTASDTRKVVIVPVPVHEAPGVARLGATVRVDLPGGRKVDGRITGVGTTASSTAGPESQTGQRTETATVPVTVTLSAGNVLDGAPVTVGFSSGERRGVLAVPVNALLATSDSEYAVRVVDGDGTVRSVPVRLGIFEGDAVEVTGELHEGARVQVPAT
ncbi:MAG TPA: peptidoglycan-binding protein [Actinoplanes sp.]|nr:peptidoglycan-binding protein [Actinoplanes sp.]